MSFLDDLFGQILQSEEAIKQRFDQLKEAHSKILEFQSKIKDAEFEIQSLWGTVKVKNHKFVEAEVELTWLKSKMEILKTQIALNQERKEKTKIENNEVESLIEKERINFVEETKEFAKSYQLSANFESEYDKKLSIELETAKKKKQQLSKDLETLQSRQNKTTMINEKMEIINRSITAMALEKDEKEETIKKLRSEKEMAKEEKQRIANEPQSSHEFKMLSEELSACQRNSEELNKRRKELLSQLYVNQQEYMQKESYMKSKHSKTKGESSNQSKAWGNRQTNVWESKKEVPKNQSGRVSLFKSTKPKENGNYSG